jgi:short-subunit dehydrogenase
MKNVLITGGTTGIGLALATQYSKMGWNIFFTGRNEERLKKAHVLIESFGASFVQSAQIDVSNKEEMENFIYEIDKNYPLDVIYANAGVSAGTLGGEESRDQINSLINTNINGVLNTLHAGIEVMKKRGYGNIGVLSSVASFFPLPSAPTYSATKAFVRTYTEALSIFYRKNTDVYITLICPGYVETPMTAVNSYKMPFLVKSEKAAELIIRALDKRKLRYIFPWQMACLVKIVDIIGIKLISKILSRLPGKSPLK